MHSIHWILVIAFVIALGVLCELRQASVRRKFNENVKREFEKYTTLLPPEEHLVRDWDAFSHSGENPACVVAVRMFLDRNSDPYVQYTGLTSALYSQIKHAFRVHWSPFLALELLKQSLVASERATPHWTPARPIIDLEVLSAPSFMLGVTPILGTTVFKKRHEYALGELEKAHNALKVRDKDHPKGRDAMLILAKLYRLTGYDGYKDQLQRVGVQRPWSHGDLERVRKHLAARGYVHKSVDDLLTFFFAV